MKIWYVYAECPEGQLKAPSYDVCKSCKHSGYLTDEYAGYVNCDAEWEKQNEDL